MASFGIEHEVAFLRPDGRFADFSNTSFAEFDRIVAGLPRYDADYPSLRIGDLGIKDKRWYIEGYERYDEDGHFTVCVPKGIEIRTTICPSIQAAVDELRESFSLLVTAAGDFTPACISYNPVRPAFRPDPPLNGWEARRRGSSPEKRTAEIPMMTYGPDLNVSFPGMSPDAAVDLGRKLTALSPYIVPFSASSPFVEGRRWEGYSYRTFVRTGLRPAALVFVGDPADLVPSQPSLTKPARVAAEAGRIELKSCDSCADFVRYGALLALIKGLAIDTTLADRLQVPDGPLHQLAAVRAFDDDTIVRGAERVLTAAAAALVGDEDAGYLHLLFDDLAARRTPAHLLIAAYEAAGSVEAALASGYSG